MMADSNTTEISMLSDEDDEYDYSDFNWTTNYDFFGQVLQQSSAEVVLKCVIYAIPMCIAFFGNLAIIVVVMRTKSLRTKFNIYIVNLAVADIFIPAVSMWMHLVNNLNDHWIFGKVLCKLHTFVQVIVVCASISTLSVLAVDRYLSTFQSRYLWITQTFQLPIIVVIWVIAIGTASPWIVYTVYRQFDWVGGHEVICQANFPSVDSRKAYYVVFCAVCFVSPLAIMFTLLICTIIKSNNRTRDIPTTSEVYLFYEIRRKAVYLLLTTVVAFCICWTPQQSLLLWDVFRDRTQKPAGILELHYAALMIAYSSSAINPVVFSIYNKYFRHALRHFCDTKCKCEDTNSAIVPDTNPLRNDSQQTHVVSIEEPSTSVTGDSGSTHVTVLMSDIQSTRELPTMISSSDDTSF